MKKLFYLILPLALLAASSAFAAEGAVWSGVASYGEGVRVVEADFTLDTDGSTFAMEDALVTALSGWSLFYLEIAPDGTTAPTDAYDLVVNNEMDVAKDILDGAGANLSDSTSSKLELVWPIIDNLSFVFSNNSVSNAIVHTRMVFYRSY